MSWHPSPNYHTTPSGERLSSRKIDVHHCPTRRVFIGTRLELMTCQPRSATLTTKLQRGVEVRRVGCRLSYTRAFGDGPRHFDPWSIDVDDT
ncbi:hypothetical protein TNCV_1418351 [Trichonephila clavipes]|nr:hypothetical protein TNCV_1418351 [Trichonephila clavipes]